MPLHHPLRRVAGMAAHERRHGLARQGRRTFDPPLVVRTDTNGKSFGFLLGDRWLGHAPSLVVAALDFKPVAALCSDATRADGVK